MHARVFLPVALITVAAVACSGRPAGTAANSTASSDSSLTSPNAASSAGEVSTAAAMTDANILAVLHEANQAEISAAHQALSASANPSVKSFARQMIRDHTKLDHAGDSVAKATNITPALPANDSLSAHAAQEAQQLTAAGKGAGFDKQYIDAQVQDHETVLALLQQFQNQAQSPQVKAAVTSAVPIVQGHLDRAKRLSATLGSETTQS